ncbi:MAG: hypothetical protein IPQ07_06405 [Myxococcales bacterium]|nr:hypothetical protein [Myxococcales bacterium]
MSSVAFGGAFFAWPYHAGVAAYLQERDAVPATARVIGTSSGAVVATMLACGIDIAGAGLALGLRADRDGLGGRATPFLRPRAFLAPHIDEMDRALPADAHVRATHRLVITLRRVPSLRQFQVSEYRTRADLLDALAGAVAVPGLTVTVFHRSARFGPCLDGGPGVPDDERPGATTLRVGVFQRGRYHIRPRPALARELLFGVPSDADRRALFERGRADAARHHGGAR